jgi:hypothetical protein
MRKLLNILSGILFFSAFLPYIWAIIHHQTVPSPVSWAIWASVDTLALIAMKKEKATSGMLTGAVAGAWVITLLAIIFGKPTVEMTEWISIAIAAIGILLWRTTGNAILVIVCAQVATLAGGIPTIAHGYSHPAQEDPIAWSIWWLGCIVGLFAIEKWNLANALQPLVFTTIETSMVILVVIRPHLLS